MFEHAYQEAAKFLRPVVVSVLRFDGRVQTSVGSYVALNPDGWVVTAAHMFELVQQSIQDAPAISAYNGAADAIRAEGLQAKAERNKLNKLIRSDDWIVRQSMWWCHDTWVAHQVHAYPMADIAVCQLQNFDASQFEAFPSFKRDSGLQLGASLCKIGYPFPQVNAEWDAAADSFRFLEGSELPRFPIEGIYTRNINAGDAPEGFPVRFLETSSPGLKGQSGGPIVDVHGVIWAIQTKTVSYPLNFSPVVEIAGKQKVQEHQFLNAGIGTHPATLQAIFDRHGVDVAWVD